jgi:hypothetical protein
VVRSKEVKAAITKYPEFKLEKRVGEYSIYRLTTNPGQYVIPLKNQAVLCQTKDWRDPAYQWFARKDLAEAFIVFKKKPDTYDKNMFSQVITDLSQIVKQPIHSSEVKVSSTLGNETIDIETSEIGHPLLIKVAYHPNWRVTGADRVYLVSPAFMLIFPTSKKIHLSFEPGALSQIGKLLSILGLLLAVSVGYWFKPSKLIEADSSKNWVRLIAIVAGLLLIFFFIGIINPDASTVMVKARRAFNCNDYNQARSLLQKVMVMSKRDSGPRNEAAIFYATTFVREGRFAEAAKELRQFISDYPNSFWTPQAVFDLAYSETNLGNVAGAIKIYQSIIDDFSTTTWAKYSKDRLKEIEKKLKAQKQ